MKIIRKDNYDNEMREDLLVAENVHEGYGKDIVSLLNNGLCRYDADYFVLVPDDYKLYEFEY